jgi:16S rRNA (uracil1498-N3)-methyltransferase
MTAARLYLPVFLDKGDICRTTEDQSRYLGAVLRMKEGDRLVVFNGTGSEYETVIRQYAEGGADLEILEKRDMPFAGISVTLCQAMPKAEKMDGIIRHATELGVNRIIPFFAARSVPRWTSSHTKPQKKLDNHKAQIGSHKLERWRKIAVEACRQSGRADIPEITDVMTFSGMLSSLAEGGLRLIPWEEETAVSLRDILREKGLTPINDVNLPAKMITLAIGPEGGFSVEEIELARSAGFVSVSLGKRVLRVETASLATLAIIQYEEEN